VPTCTTSPRSATSTRTLRPDWKPCCARTRPFSTNATMANSPPLARSGDAAFLHRGEHLDHAQQHLTGLIADLIAQAAHTGNVRDDIAPQELARYCLHALGAASGLPSTDAVSRLVEVTVGGLRTSQ
jgi:transcriptional regulator SbtR-like protein